VLAVALWALPTLSAAPDGLVFGSATGCGVYLDGTDVTFARCNVRVVNGTGITDRGNGRGNLVVGYEDPVELGDQSSHNVLIGDGHILLGNTTRGLFAGAGHVAAGVGIVALGDEHQALGDWTTIVGGEANSASGEYSSVFGGQFSRATGRWATVDGGYQNTASGTWSWVGGGNHAEATATVAVSVGGLFTRATHVRSVSIGTLARSTRPDSIEFGHPLAP
jgi:hypothetical protein